MNRSLAALAFAVILLPAAAAHALPTLESAPVSLPIAAAQSPVPVLAPPISKASALKVPALQDLEASFLPAPFPLEYAPEWRPADAADPFGVRFVCPTAGGSAITGEEVIDTTTCPYLLRDQYDLLSQPTILVEPTNPVCMAFHAMHGGRGVHAPTAPQPPSATSRHDGLHQPFTLWRSCGDGAWEDNPYNAPEAVRIDGYTVFGEENAATMDAQGNVVLGGIIAYQGPQDPAMQYMVFVHRLQRINTQPGYLDPSLFDPESPEATMSDLQMAYVSATDELVVTWIETMPGPPEEAQRQVRTLHVPAGGGTWTEVGFSDRVGPCTDITELVPAGNLLFVGCAPAAGYFGDAGFAPTFAQVHAFDATSWQSRRVSQAPVGDGHLTFIDGQNGYQILMASGADPNGNPFAKVTFGAYGDDWSEVTDYGADFHGAAATESQGAPLSDARITAAVHDDSTSLIHVLWAERYTINPLDPTTLGAKPIEKTYAVVRARGGFLGSFDLSYGTLSRVVQPETAYQGTSEDIYWDQHDSLLRWRDPRGGNDQIFVAFGDYGTVRVAQVLSENVPVPVPFPPAPVPAIALPAASSTASLATAALSATLGLMLLRLLAARKKARVETPTL